MKAVRVSMTVEVDQVANALAVRTPVPVQLIFERRQWRAACESPLVETDPFESLEQALVAGARQVAAEMQAAVDDRPVIAGRITPENIPQGRF